MLWKSVIVRFFFSFRVVLVDFFLEAFVEEVHGLVVVDGFCGVVYGDGACGGVVAVPVLGEADGAVFDGVYGECGVDVDGVLVYLECGVCGYEVSVVELVVGVCEGDVGSVYASVGGVFFVDDGEEEVFGVAGVHVL